MTRDNKTILIIPAYNEAGIIGMTIDSIKTVAPQLRITVIDDGSQDNTAEIAKSHGVEVVSLGANQGKGAALNRAISDFSSEYWLFLDADLGATAGEGIKLLEPLITGQADVVVGDLPPAAVKGGFGLVKELARWGIKVCAGIIVNEPLSGQRALRSEVIDKVKRFENGYGIEVGMTIDAVRYGFKLIEMPLNMSHAESGRNAAGFIHRGRQFLDVLRVILKRILGSV